MMPYFGDFLIFGAAGATLFSLITYALAWRGDNRYLSLARSFYAASTVFITGAIGVLWYLIITHDFSVAYVFQYSSTDLPLGFLISTLWGGQQGTFLLWAFLAAIMGVVMMRTAGSFEKGNMVWLNLFVLSLLLMMIKMSPFEIMPVFRAEGAGLNPLLQNFWMQIHPPIMFVGFAATTFPFVFALTGLVERRYHEWSLAARRWTLFAWLSLGIALILGGYWAYETLGWGGYWAWDPVENASLIPWLFLTAQIHTLFVKRVRRGLMRFSLIMVCLSFWSVLYGTFLTRSGVLADFSVHSFVDLGINAFLATGIICFVAIGLFLIAWRWRDIANEPSFSKVASRSYLVTLGILAIFISAALVLIGTSMPLLTRITDNPSSVGLDYYFKTMAPIAILVLSLMAVFPAFRWNSGMSKPRLLIVGATSMVVTIGVLLGLQMNTSIMYILLFGAAAASLVTNGWVYVESLVKRAHAPAYLSHIGLAITLIGAGASTGLEERHVIRLDEGETVSVMDHQFTFASITDRAAGFDCLVEVVDPSGGSFTATLPHDFPPNSDGVMKKPHVQFYLNHDLYIAPQTFEPPDEEPGVLPLTRGGQAQLDKYVFSFAGFSMADDHASESESESMSATAQLSVTYDGVTETIAPVLTVTPDSVIPSPATFDNGAGSVTIAGVRPEDGGVMVRVTGDFVPTGSSQSTLVIEASTKPLILLFWVGCGLVFIGGIMSLMKRRRRERTSVSAVSPVDATRSADVPASRQSA